MLTASIQAKRWSRCSSIYTQFHKKGSNLKTVHRFLTILHQELPSITTQKQHNSLYSNTATSLLTFNSSSHVVWSTSKSLASEQELKQLHREKTKIWSTGKCTFHMLPSKTCTLNCQSSQKCHRATSCYIQVHFQHPEHSTSSYSGKALNEPTTWAVVSMYWCLSTTRCWALITRI